MKLKMSSVVDLHASIARLLAGRPRVVRRNNEDVIVDEPYKLDADSLLALARNYNALDPEVRAHQIAYRAKMKEVMDAAPEKKILRGSAEEMALAESIEPLLGQERDIDLTKIALSKLKVDDNPGIARELAALLPILDNCGLARNAS